MKTIYKYPLSLTGQTIVEMPYGAKVLTAQLQENALMVWAEVDTYAPKMIRKEFLSYGTGWEMTDDPQQYIATVQIGRYVWHVYEVLK